MIYEEWLKKIDPKKRNERTDRRIQYERGTRNFPSNLGRFKLQD